MHGNKNEFIKKQYKKIALAKARNTLENISAKPRWFAGQEGEFKTFLPVAPRRSLSDTWSFSGWKSNIL